MTNDVSNLMLEQLKAIRGKIDGMALDVMDIKTRMSAVEGQLGHMSTQLAAQSVRMDRFDERLNRIERRLELVEA